MCSRVATSIANATGYGEHMVVNSLGEYEARAINYAKSVSYDVKLDGSHIIERRGNGALIELRRKLFLDREKMPLFDTRRWTRNFEKGLAEAWRRWVAGTCIGTISQFDVIYINISPEGSDEWEDCDGPEKQSGSILVQDEDLV